MRNSIITELEYKDGIYQGQTLQSRYKQGLGVYVWENGSAFYGEWKSDQIDGVGILFLPPRTTIQGHFTMGKLNGSCVIQTRIGRYYGKWLNGFPDGPMTSLLKDGEVTITFQDGRPCRGLSSREFTCEVPQLKSVQCHGSSAIQVLELPSGTFYGITGKDQGNKPNGLGVFVSIEGLFSCGQYKNGFLCGLGRTQQPGGEIYSGFFESGKFHGKGIYLFKEDELKWAKGLWRFGELIEIYESGFVRDCQSPKDLLCIVLNYHSSLQ